MAKRPISREYRIYLAIWRKAFAERDLGLKPVQVKASNHNMAISIRQGMYRAIKPYRCGEEFDEDLRNASELFVAYLHKQDDPTVPTTIELRPRLSLSELERQLLDMGLNEADLLQPGEKASGLGLQEFLTGPDELPPTAHRSTPFYSREED